MAIPRCVTRDRNRRITTMSGTVGKSDTISSGGRERAPRLPPRWLVRSAWVAHRALYRTTGGRIGLGRPRECR
jgi:hypothetical protein